MPASSHQAGNQPRNVLARCLTIIIVCLSVLLFLHVFGGLMMASVDGLLIALAGIGLLVPIFALAALRRILLDVAVVLRIAGGHSIAPPPVGAKAWNVEYRRPGAPNAQLRVFAVTPEQARAGVAALGVDVVRVAPDDESPPA